MTKSRTLSDPGSIVAIRESVIKSGHSLAVVIPSGLVNQIGVRAKDKVEVTPDPQAGTLTVKFLNIRQLPLV